MRAAQGLSVIYHTVKRVSIVFIGARAADCALARKQYRLVQSCEFTSILHAYDAAHYRGGRSSVDDSERVSCLL